MILKNAFKILASKFGLVWTLAIYTFGLAIIMVSMSLPLFIILRSAIQRAGINDEFFALYQSFLNGMTLDAVFEELKALYERTLNLFKTDRSLRVGSRIYFLVGIVLVMRFLLGLYELPMIAVLDGAMSSNAKLGFTGSFISKLGMSSKFVPCKMVYTIAFDAVTLGIIYLISWMFKIPFLSVFTPFLMMAVLIFILALRYTLVSMWTPAIICGGLNEADGLIFSFKNSTKNFKSIFSVFVLMWILAFAVNLFIGLFTFGAGLIITIPCTMLLICIINMTIYYSKNGKRFYVDGVVITPPTAELVEFEG